MRKKIVGQLCTQTPHARARLQSWEKASRSVCLDSMSKEEVADQAGITGRLKSDFKDCGLTSA